MYCFRLGLTKLAAGEMAVLVILLLLSAAHTVSDCIKLTVVLVHFVFMDRTAVNGVIGVNGVIAQVHVTEELLQREENACKYAIQPLHSLA